VAAWSAAIIGLVNYIHSTYAATQAAQAFFDEKLAKKKMVIDVLRQEKGRTPTDEEVRQREIENYHKEAEYQRKVRETAEFLDDVEAARKRH
jgi:hypothetical protein